jgi:ubiquinol-cytochrome c reductase cytochrome b subunit
VAGQNNPTGVEVKSVERDTVAFTPYATMKDALALSVFLIFFAWFVFYIPNYLGHSDNYIVANPLQTPQHIVPEWYFLPYYAILRAIPSKLGGVTAMVGAIVVTAFLPWLDSSRVRSARYRPVFKIFFWVFVACGIGLGYLGAMPPEGGYVVAARLLTAYWFLHFLIILPALGLFETPLPLPASIADSILQDNAATPAPAMAKAA